MATYKGSKQERYYINNKESILAKKHAKTEANKIIKEEAKIKNKTILENKIARINNDGRGIYNAILGEGYIDDSDTLKDFLDDVVPVQYDLGGMSNLQILVDYIALNEKLFSSRKNPWKLIEKIYGISLKVSINQKAKYYKKELE